jgi:hypothetical protein
MTEAEKMRAGFAQLVQACDALKSVVDRSELDPMTLKGIKVMGQRRDATLDPELAKQVFHAVLNTLREACDQGSKMGLPIVEEVRRSSIIIPSQEFRP